MFAPEDSLDPCPYGGYFLDLRTVGEAGFVTRWWSREHGLGWLLFNSPVELLEARAADEVGPLLDRLSAAVDSGLIATGFLTYEGSLALHWPHLAQDGSDPIAWFALHDRPPVFFNELLPAVDEVRIEDAVPEWDIGRYGQAFEEVKAALEAGESYQVNLTFRYRFSVSGDPADLFVDRCGVAPPAYASFLRCGTRSLLSFSPELFFQREGRRILMRPMKGTLPAGASRGVDDRLAEGLRRDPKTIAENLMIVDMIRSDLGSVCDVGSVGVSDFMAVERHRNLLQVTSTVSGSTSAGLAETLRATLPPASVTGAPKRSTCHLIDRLEDSPRSVYCGVAGILTRDFQRLSLCIRTAEVDADRRGEFGVGSGVVWDSDCEAEYAECLAKTDFLFTSGRQWALIESLSTEAAGRPEGRARHLARLAVSARELGIPLDRDRAARLLEEAAARGGGSKVRLLLGVDGELEVEVGDSELPPGPLRAAVAPFPVSLADRGLLFKSTARQRYERFLESAPETVEVLLFNEEGEVTEFCRGSAVVLLEGRLITPHPGRGGLPSTAASALVGDGGVEYGRIPLDRILEADAIWFANAVLGVRPVRLESQDGSPLLEPRDWPSEV
jgi:para-aminobenzoate synthetase / 4-amino-4-deoxychorismate lyase